MEYIVTSNLHPYIVQLTVVVMPQTPKPPETVSVDAWAQGKRLTILGGLNLVVSLYGQHESIMKQPKMYPAIAIREADLLLVRSQSLGTYNYT